MREIDGKSNALHFIGQEIGRVDPQWPSTLPMPCCSPPRPPTSSDEAGAFGCPPWDGQAKRLISYRQRFVEAFGNRNAIKEKDALLQGEWAEQGLRELETLGERYPSTRT